jgi:hypothetical protein
LADFRRRQCELPPSRRDAHSRRRTTPSPSRTTQWTVLAHRRFRSGGPLARAAERSIETYVSGTTNLSTYHYDDAGILASVGIDDGRDRSVWLRLDASGLFLDRDEADGSLPVTSTNPYGDNSNGDPREVHLYVDGITVGDISNNGTSDVDYVTSIARHQMAPANSSTNPFATGNQTGFSSLSALAGGVTVDLGGNAILKGGEFSGLTKSAALQACPTAPPSAGHRPYGRTISLSHRNGPPQGRGVGQLAPEEDGQDQYLMLSVAMAVRPAAWLA